MPTPLELAASPISWIVFAIYATLLVAEALFPGRPLPRVRGWRLMGLAAFAAYFLLSSYLPLLWDGWFAQWRLVDLTAQPEWLQVGAGLLVYELGVWTWHRAMHRYTPLWRVFHQMHHSAERVDAAGAFWFSPFDMVGWTALTSLSLVLVVGLAPWPATLVILIATFLTIFQHANLRTPRWLGYIVQRPESHSLHHARGVHWHNFSDLPVFDLLFGTFRNPATFAEHTGFYDGASYRVAEMVGMIDVSVPRSAVALSATAGARWLRTGGPKGGAPIAE